MACLAEVDHVHEVGARARTGTGGIGDSRPKEQNWSACSQELVLAGQFASHTPTKCVILMLRLCCINNRELASGKC